MRVPTLNPNIIPKHKIATFGMPKRAKVRPLNPQLSARDIAHLAETRDNKEIIGKSLCSWIGSRWKKQ